MSIIKKRNTDFYEFDLDNEYLINFVDLKSTEDEHTHKFVELVYTLGGRGVHRLDGTDYHVNSGDMLIINHNCRHTVTPIENLRYVDIMLKPEYVDETLRGTDDIFLLLDLRDFAELSDCVIKDNLLIRFDGEQRQRIETLLNWTKEEQQEALPARDLVLRSILSVILGIVFREMAKDQNARYSVNDRLLLFIEKNCRSSLSLAELAKKCGYSQEHFSRIFKKYTGVSPSSYLMDCRIKSAKELLIKTDKSIETIIYESGFSNRTAFFKKFFEHEGCTPLQFRKNQK